MTGPLRWGVVGTGGIAADFCEALTHSCCEVVNVAGSSPDKARADRKSTRLNSSH